MATRKLSDEEKHQRKQARQASATPKKETPEIGKAGDEEEPVAQGIEIGVEDAPLDTFTEEKKPGILENVLTKLGIKDDPKAPPIKVPATAKLNAAQSQFCDMATPIAGSILIISLGWAWGQLDADYRVLAPSEQAAESIVAPLIRIYARSNKALIRAASPNTVDALICLNGVILYVHASMTMLHQINAMKKENAEENDTTDRPRNIRNRSTLETQSHGASSRRTHLSRADNGSVESLATDTSIEYPSGLTERERQNYASLAELRERDIAARARRSGRFA